MAAGQPFALGVGECGRARNAKQVCRTAQASSIRGSAMLGWCAKMDHPSWVTVLKGTCGGPH